MTKHEALMQNLIEAEDELEAAQRANARLADHSPIGDRTAARVRLLAAERSVSLWNDGLRLSYPEPATPPSLSNRQE